MGKKPFLPRLSFEEVIHILSPYFFKWPVRGPAYLLCSHSLYFQATLHCLIVSNHTEQDLTIPIKHKVCTCILPTPLKRMPLKANKFCRTHYIDSGLVSEKAIAAVRISITAFL